MACGGHGHGMCISVWVFCNGFLFITNIHDLVGGFHHGTFNFGGTNFNLLFDGLLGKSLGWLFDSLLMRRHSEKHVHVNQIQAFVGQLQWDLLIVFW